MGIKIKKIDNYYKLEEEKGYKIFYEPIPNKSKILTLNIIKKLPREIKEQILHKLSIGSIKDRYVYEMINKKFESILYYREIYESS